MVDPREFGAIRPFDPSRTSATGPSPRVRGSHLWASLVVAATGSIPAGAGKPGECDGSPRLAQVHPRACGGNGSRICCDDEVPASFLITSPGASTPFGLGLLCRCSIPLLFRPVSPRVRGVLLRSAFRRCLVSVYPRACAAFLRVRFRPLFEWGLPPRVRGLPSLLPPAGLAASSTPARGMFHCLFPRSAVFGGLPPGVRGYSVPYMGLS